MTFPLLRPFVAIAVLLRTLEAFKTFGTIRVLTGGGPGISTEIINLTIYRTALQDFSVGRGGVARDRVSRLPLHPGAPDAAHLGARFDLVEA